MIKFVGYAAGVLTMAACSTGNFAVAPEASAPPSVPLSGVDMRYVDETVRPQDDLYRHLNGKWLDTFELPADKGSYGAFTLIDDVTQEQLRSLVESLPVVDSGAAAVPDAAALQPGSQPANSRRRFADHRQES